MMKVTMVKSRNNLEINKQSGATFIWHSRVFKEAPVFQVHIFHIFYLDI